jgi:hypothetical protein
MRVKFIQVKNGVPTFACFVMKSMAACVVSSSIVSMRFSRRLRGGRETGESQRQHRDEYADRHDRRSLSVHRTLLFSSSLHPASLRAAAELRHRSSSGAECGF